MKNDAEEEVGGRMAMPSGTASAACGYLFRIAVKPPVKSKSRQTQKHSTSTRSTIWSGFPQNESRRVKPLFPTGQQPHLYEATESADFMDEQGTHEFGLFFNCESGAVGGWLSVAVKPLVKPSQAESSHFSDAVQP